VRFLPPQAYQPIAGRTYAEVRDRLAPALPNALIEHIGSSSIAGAISKGDLDVFVGVPRGEFEAARETIRGLGFQEKLDTLRTPQLWPFVAPGYPIDVGIQLVERGSRFEFFRRFRDLLNRDPALLQRYNALKRASVPLDEQEYRARKSAFIEDVLARHA
jgi:GrpB-like predicted nucleotidyltransferase (UPF0157 family)